jgi:hypothetical protein
MRSWTRCVSSDLEMTSWAYRFRHLRKSWYASRLRSLFFTFSKKCSSFARFVLAKPSSSAAVLRIDRQPTA